MTITEILEQAQALSPEERKELAKLLIDSLDVSQKPETEEPEQHWGRNLRRLLDELGPIEMVHPEIEDPVEWVKQIRREQRQKRLGDWGEGIADTTVILHYFRNYVHARAWVHSKPVRFAVVSFTWMEVMEGTSSKANQGDCSDYARFWRNYCERVSR
jgi:hypothetical protein